MSTQKLLLGTFAGAVFVFLVDWLFYRMLMADKIWAPVAGVTRDQPLWLWLIIGIVVFMAMFTYIYGKGVEGTNRTQQGLRFGIMVGIMVGFGLGLIWYALQSPWELKDYLIDGVYTTVKLALSGVIIAHVTGVPADVRGKGGSGGGGDV